MESRFLQLRPQDVPRLEELCREQDDTDGTNYAPPTLFDKNGILLPNILLAMKLVRGGQMTQGYVFEAVPEMMSFGLDVRSSAAALRSELPAAMWLLQQKDFNGFRSLVPKSRVELWERTLNKRLHMKRFDDQLAHFYLDFREG